jgi:MFS family permease
MADPKLNETSALEAVAVGSTWSPLKSRLFAVLLLTQLFTQMAVFMNGLAGAWLLTDITDSPAVVASLQIAIALPAFLLALLAGALADIVSRKRIILFSLAGSAIVAGVFAVISVTDSHSSTSVLGLTAVLGVLTALAAPAWIAIIPGLVSRSDLAGAMTLSSAGMSAAMAVGPAIAGFIIAAADPTWVFVLNMLAFAVGILALRIWKPAPRTGLPAEHLASAIRIGLQYVRYDRPLKVVIGKIIPFALTGTALISLLPAVARFQLNAGPALFGLLSGAGGIGAVVALLVMPRIRRRFGPDTIVFGAMLIEAAVLIVVATTTNLVLAFIMLFIAGAATLALVSTVMTVLQIVLPAWIRGRGVAVYLLALQGSFAIGAFLWGTVAEQTSLQTALVAAGIVMAISAVLLTTLRLSRYMDINTDMVQIMPDTPTVTSVYDDDGPILLTAQWQIDPDRRDKFVAAMEPVRRALKQKGALSWHLVENVEQPGRMLESFTMATWSEYKRLAQRATMADKDVLDAVHDAAGSDLPPLQAYRVIKVRSRRKSHSGVDSQ